MTQQKLGVILTEEYNTDAFGVGTRHRAPDGKTYRFVKAQAAKTIGLVYGIDEAFEVYATAAVKTESHPLLGVPAFTSSAPASGFTYKYFWIQTAGNFARVEAAAASADNAGCYATQTAGKIDDGDDSGKLIRGWKFTTAAGSATNTTAYGAEEQSLDQA